VLQLEQSMLGFFVKVVRFSHSFLNFPGVFDLLA
jgi:hypothetical protein